MRLGKFGSNWVHLKVIDINKLKSFFPIEGAQVKLKEFAKSNITDSYIDWLNDPTVVRYSNQRFTIHTRLTSLDYFSSFVNTENLFLAVYLKEEERYIGTMSVYISTVHETADIGILIGDKSCWGRGIGGDAWCLIVNWLIDIAEIRKVTGGTLRCNSGMVQIMINSGMKPDGIRMAQEIVDGHAHDVLFFSKFK